MKQQSALFGPGPLGGAEDSGFNPAGLPRTALPVLRGCPRHLEAHLERLHASALALDRLADWLPSLRGEILAWLGTAIPDGDAALRLILDPKMRQLSARLEVLPSAPCPYRMRVLPHPKVDRRSDPLAPHKGLLGPWGADVLTEARRLGAEDALLLWADDSLAETAIASVGIESGGVLILPPPQGRVASLAERLDLPRWAESQGLRIEVDDIPLARALEGRIWCFNALRGIWSGTLLL